MRRAIQCLKKRNSKSMALNKLETVLGVTPEVLLNSRTGGYRYM